jgi:hypothetical protein
MLNKSIMKAVPHRDLISINLKKEKLVIRSSKVAGNSEEIKVPYPFKKMRNANTMKKELVV